MALMKILQIHNFYQVPGGECAVVRAEKALLEAAGHAVCQFARDSTSIDGLSLYGKIAMLRRIPQNPSVDKEVLSTVNQFHPDVAHVHNIFPLLSPSVYAALRKAGVPVVQTHHNFRVLCPNGLFFNHGRICEACLESLTACCKNRCVKGSRILSALYARAIYRGWQAGAFSSDITMHIALNPFFKAKLTNGGVPPEAIRVCGNFVSSFSDQTAVKENYFLFLGRLSTEKGLFTLLQASRQTMATIKIAGTGPLYTEIARFIEQHGLKNVELLGFVDGDRKIDLIRKSIAVVIPSQWYENFPIAGVEAQAQGTPVLASRIGGMPSVVAHGESGYLFEPGNEGELAGLLNKLAGSPELVRQLSDQSLQRAKSLFTPEIHCRRLLEIYAEAAR